jgi:ATP-binding cassette subfamily C protein PrsD
MAGAPLPRRSEIRSALLDCAGWFGGIAVFSAIVNLLYLTGSLYMLQVYDRVLTSRSVETLIGLSLIVLGAFVFQGLLDSLRSRMLARIGARFDELLAPRVFQLAATSSSRNLRETEASPVRDLDQVRNFLSGMGPTALFDMPFLLIFLAVTFMLHPWLGWLTVFGGVVIVALTFLTEWRSRSPALTLTEMSASARASSTRRGATLRPQRHSAWCLR